MHDACPCCAAADVTCSTAFVSTLAQTEGGGSLGMRGAPGLAIGTLRMEL